MRDKTACIAIDRHAIAVTLLLALLVFASVATTTSFQEVVLSILDPETSTVHSVAHRPDFWHTRGNTIRDSGNHLVQIAGLNWSGLETTAAVPGGLTARDYRAILRSVAAAGYNTIRLPFSNQIVEAPGIPTAIAFQNSEGPINQDLVGLNSLEIMDHIVAAANEAGLHVILDNHRSEAGSSAQENGLWYTAAYPEERWLADWIALATRYRNSPTVVGVDLRNEPHNAMSNGACWGCSGPHDWRLAAERAGNAVLRINPNLLIFVEGTDTVDGQSYWWGGNLSGVRTAPVRLAIPNRLVYSPHVYGPAEYRQPWFNSLTTPATLASLSKARWAFIFDENLAPLFLGEFGATNDAASLSSTAPGSEGQWFHSLVSFLNTRPSIGWAYWSLNGEDHYALLDSIYTFHAANRNKLAALSTLLPAPYSSPAAPPKHAASAIAIQPPALAPRPPFLLAASRVKSISSPELDIAKANAIEIRLTTARALDKLPIR